MGLLDKAKEKQLEGQIPAPDETAEPVSAETKKAAPAKKKKTVKKKTGDPDARPPRGSGAGPTARKKTGAGPSVKKKAAPSKAPSRPARKTVKKEPEKPEIEGLPENLEFAGLWSRLAAAAIDWAILLFAIIIITIPVIMSADMAGIVTGMILIFVLPVIYFLFTEGRTGQSLAKGWFRVKVISLDGKALNPDRYKKAAVWKGIFFLNIIDIIIGMVVNHKDTRQRMSQYDEDLIVIKMEKKKLKYGSSDQTEEPSEPAEAHETDETSWDSDQPAPVGEGEEHGSVDDFPEGYASLG